MKIANSVAPALALIVGLSSGQLASAQNKQNKSTAAKSTPEVSALTRFSNEGKSFVDSVRSARISIFDGDPKMAMDLMNKAKASLQAATKDAPSFNVKTTTSVQGKVVGIEQATTTAAMVPVDGQMVVSDDYSVTPEKQAHISKANEHLKKGEAKEAAEEFRLAQIDIGFNRMWIPLAASEKHLEDAVKLANAGKYYEANLALKAIEDGYTTDSVQLVEDPKHKS
ncbi:MAG: YfdX family protein [Acidobacteriota bacterium]